MTDGPRRRPRPSASTRSGGSGATGRAPVRKRAPAKASATSSTSRRAPAKAAARKAPAKTTARKAPAKAAARKTAARTSSPRKTSTGARRPGRPGRRIAAGLVVSVVMVGFLLVGVFPTRTWLAQRDETQDRQAELDRIRAEQAVQEERIEDLKDPEVIEQIAREEYGRVRPGERAFRIFPSAVPPVDLPDTWPFVGADDWLNR